MQLSATSSSEYEKIWHQVVLDLRTKNSHRYHIGDLCVLLGVTKQAYYKYMSINMMTPKEAATHTGEIKKGWNSYRDTAIKKSTTG